MSDPLPIAAIAPRRPSLARFVALALAVPVLLIATSWWLGAEYAATEAMRLKARAAFDQRAAASTLIARITDAESSHRGFVITGDPAFLSGYAPARTDVLATFDNLTDQLDDDPALSQQLRLLHGLATRKFAEMDDIVAKRRSEGLDAAIRRLREHEGRQLMNEMRVVSAQMLALAERERDARVHAYRARVDTDRVGLWIGIAATGFLLLAAAFVNWRQANARYRARLAAFSIAERNRAILDATIDAIVFLTPSGSIDTVNAAAAAMFGYHPDELAGRDIGALIPSLGRPVAFHERIGLVDGGVADPYLPDRAIVHRDGHEIPVDIALGVMPQPDGYHIVASVRDVSERQRIERVKEELISTVSHELRTPLTSVVGALGLLRAGSGGAVPPLAARLVEIAENNSRRLIRLINDMLDIDRIQSGRLPLDRTTIDLRDVVRRAGEGSEGLARGAGIRIACRMPDAPVCVAGDAERLLQVITNLVSNAIRASPPGGTVTIGLSSEQSRAYVTIDDDGPGIPAEFRDRIFGRFERTQGEQSAGTGLGLAISREIVMRHDGRIWFEDRDRGGTRFAFTLDLVEDVRTAPAPRDESWGQNCDSDGAWVGPLGDRVVVTAAAAHAASATRRAARGRRSSARRSM